MYPELKKAGGLSNALNIEFAKINSSLRVVSNDYAYKIPVVYARVENDNKLSQIYIAAEEKLYMPDFWRDGVCLAHAKTNDISSLATVVDFWLNHDVPTKVLAEKFSFVQPADKAKAFDEGNEVVYTWNCILENDSKTELYDFIKLAITDEILSKLFPFTSLYTLCFSRCTGYPYDIDDLPKVTPKQFEHFAVQNYKRDGKHERASGSFEHVFVVSKGMNEIIGEGNAEEALRIVKDNLPDNIKPAIKGTKDTMHLYQNTLNQHL